MQMATAVCLLTTLSVRMAAAQDPGKMMGVKKATTGTGTSPTRVKTVVTNSVPKQTPAPTLTSIMAHACPAAYRRCFPLEVLTDLKVRFGLQSVMPETLESSIFFTFESPKTNVRESLLKLAEAGPFMLESRGNMVFVWQKADDKTLSGLTERLKAQDPLVRAEAAWDLAGLADPRIYPLLAGALQDPDVGVANWAARGLKDHMRVLPHLGQGAAILAAMRTRLPELGSAPVAQPGKPVSDQRLVEHALVTLLKHTDPKMRVTAALILRDCRDERAEAALVSLVRDQDPAVREAAARALGGQNKPYLAIDMLLEMLRSGGNAESDWRRRCWVLDRFDATCNDPRVLDAISQYLRKDPGDAIGAYHSSSLALGRLRTDAARTRLTEQLRSGAVPPSDVVEGLDASRDPQAVDVLLPFLKDEKTPYVAHSSASALCRMPLDPAVATRVRAALKGGVLNVRKILPTMLLQRQAKPLSPLLDELANDLAPEVRASIVWARFERDGPRSFDALAAALRDPVTAPRAAAALKLFHQPRALAALQEFAAKQPPPER
jgi:HEAT repeat protein